MRPRSNIGIILLILLLLTGCGLRGIPVLQQAQLDQKRSILMITASGLQEPIKQTIHHALRSWRDTDQISYEWLSDAVTLDDNMLHTIRSKSYDYIYVVGNSLLSSAYQEAVQDKKSKWTLLQDQWSTNETMGPLDKLALMQVDPKLTEPLKDNWVLQQKAPIEWVTRAANPIPSTWAPSEEADHIVLLDNNEQWLQQLSFQVKQHASKWIVFHTPVEETMIQKAKAIGVPVIDLSTFMVDLDWDVILTGELEKIRQGSWKPGLLSYTEQELKQIKIK